MFILTPQNMLQPYLNINLQWKKKIVPGEIQTAKITTRPSGQYSCGFVLL